MKKQFVSHDKIPNSISNVEAKAYVTSKMPFRGSNLKGIMKSNGVYVVLSYDYYPVFIHYKGKWFENANRFSPTTAKQMGQCRPNVKSIDVLPEDEMYELMHK